MSTKVIVLFLSGCCESVDLLFNILALDFDLDGDLLKRFEGERLPEGDLDLDRERDLDLPLDLGGDREPRPIPPRGDPGGDRDEDFNIPCNGEVGSISPLL